MRQIPYLWGCITINERSRDQSRALIPRSKATGWGVVEGVEEVLREYPITLGRWKALAGSLRQGGCTPDYVLVYRNRKHGHRRQGVG